MPVVRISMRSGKTTAYQKAVADNVHAALVRAFKIPAHDRIQLLQVLDGQHFEAPPAKSDKFTIIEITAFKGRSFEAKKELYRTIADYLAKDPGIPGDDILIVLHEPPLENWGIRGGKPASEVPFGFKVDV